MEAFRASEWVGELSDFVRFNSSDCLALFSLDGTLLYANRPMSDLLAGDPVANLLNPNLATIIQLAGQDPLPESAVDHSHKVFEGFMTFGNYHSRNVSLLGRIYRREDRILILAGLESLAVLEQIDRMHELNAEVNNLDRQLIKEKKVLERTLAKLGTTNEELTRLSATKDKLFSILSHDLRNPFNAIMGFSELILMNLENNDYSELSTQVREIGKQASITYRLLENLLNWANTQTGSIAFMPDVHQLVWFLESNIEQVQSMAVRKEITLGLGQVKGDWPVLIDENMISTVLRNLLTNAIKFTPAKGRVELNAEPWQEPGSAVQPQDLQPRQVPALAPAQDHVPAYIRISVTDTGLGMDKEELARLFKVGEHKSRLGTDKEEGTGLGLMLCEEFVKKNGGRIWAESSPGQGSTFNFTVPLAPKSPV